MLKVILVDDEKACLAALEEKLKLLDANIKVLSICSNGPDAIEAIESLRPDAVFLDISMPQMDAFTMLQEIDTIDFELIFTTAHNEYAIKAIRMSAFDFLLKPVSMEELEECITRLQEKVKQKKILLEKQQQVNNFIQLFRNPANTEAKITLPTQNGLMFIPIKDIVRAQSESNYTCFFLSNGKKELVSKTMKEFEDILCSYNFFRVHKSHIVNLGCVSHYFKGDGGRLLLTDGTEVEVSVRKKADLLERLLDRH
jgi:two-component system LytT family response regulator